MDKEELRRLATVNQMLERFRATFVQRITTLEQAAQALQTGNLNQTLYQSVIQEVHKLVGGLGTFGYEAGSLLAREIENILTGDIALGQMEGARLSQLIISLQQELAKPSTFSSTVISKQFYTVLVLDDNVKLIEQLEEPVSWLQIETASDLTIAREKIAQAAFDVILLVGLPNPGESKLALLQEIKQQCPTTPVLAFVEEDNLAERVAISRLRGCSLLQKTLSTSCILEAIAQVLPTQVVATKVMIVDDDPAVLAVLSELLEAWGLQVTSLPKSEQFWDVLTATNPDLLILDLNMPTFHGLDLCRVVRQDWNWKDLPILVVTASTEAIVIQQAFAAGADDFITKPVVGIDLVTRVLTRIERSRCQKQLEDFKRHERQNLQQQATIDALTQIANRRRFDEYLNQVWQQSIREQVNLALIFCDIDYFKAYNDCYGHQAGDECLKRIALATKEIAKRPTDLVARYGGEEFVVILPKTNIEGAVHLAQQIQDRVAQLQILHPQSLVSNYVTISMGIACMVPTTQSSPESLVAATDRALYAAKAGGRNTYCLADYESF